MITQQERKLIIKLREQGKKQDEIASLLGCSQATVCKWIKHNQNGRTFETLPRSGRPTQLNSQTLKILKHKLTSKIKSVNQKYCSLSTKQLSEMIEEEIGIKYCNRHVERIMHKLGFSLIKPRSKHIRQDPQKIEEFRAEFKKNSIRNIWVMSSSHLTK